MLIPETLHSLNADGTLGVVTPDGKFHPVPPDGHLSIVPDPKLAAWMEAKEASGLELPMMGLMNNSDGTVFQTDRLVPMLTTPAARQRLIQTAVLYTQAQKQAGIVLDFESIPDANQKISRSSSTNWARRSTHASLKLMVALPAADWELRLQVDRATFRRHHPDELRPALADFAARPDRRAGLVRDATSTTS